MSSSFSLLKSTPLQYVLPIWHTKMKKLMIEELYVFEK